MDLISYDDAAKKLGISIVLIHYYIKEGLLSSPSDQTGRFLSQPEFNELGRIILLQTLGLNVSEIGSLQEKSITLKDALQKRIDMIMSDPDDITQAAIVCRNIQMECSDYESLDPFPHLEHIRDMKSKGGIFPVLQGSFYREAPATESTGNRNVYPHPFARFFARTIDAMICLFFVATFIRLVYGWDPITAFTVNILSESGSRTGTLWFYSVYILMFAVEPLFIHFLGTTPGKMIFGVRILAADGSKLTIKDSYLRIFRLLRYGYGFMIPLYIIYRYIRSFFDCRTGVELPWDTGFTMTCPEKIKMRHVIGFFASIMLITLINEASGLLIEIPRNKAPLTEEAFYENVNHIAKYNSIDTSYFPEYSLTVENGYVTGVSFVIEENEKDTIFSDYYPMYTAFMAFAGSRPGADAYSINYASDAKRYFSNAFSDFSFVYKDITVTNTVDITGYSRNILSGYLYKNVESPEHIFRQHFELMINN